MATVDDKKVIFSMVGVSKTIQQNQKQVLKNIYLSFFYGAKIGIIGLNGAGKSTLMKIIAGLDQQYQGEVVWSPGYTVGYLPQDPPLNESKTVKENVMEGVQHVYDALAEYDQINDKFGLPEYYEDPDKMEKLMNRQAELQDIIDSTDAWNMDSKLERAMDALRCDNLQIITRGSAEFDIDGLKANDVDLQTYGASDISIDNLDSKSVSIKIHGAGDCEVSGSTGSVEVSISGAGDIDLSDLVADSYSQTIAGAGNVRKPMLRK